jgi:hypothetical protein
MVVSQKTWASAHVAKALYPKTVLHSRNIQDNTGQARMAEMSPFPTMENLSATIFKPTER